MVSDMTDRFLAATLPTAQGRVPTEWTDYNGHMNVAYYVLAFDRGTDGLLTVLGMDPGNVRLGAGGSAFVLEMHVTYERELRLDDEWSVHSQLVDADHKRIHLFHEMRHAREGWLAATNEVIAMHIDMESRRSAPFPPEVQRRVDALRETHAALPRPDALGQIIGVRRAPTES